VAESCTYLLKIKHKTEQQNFWNPFFLGRKYFWGKSSHECFIEAIYGSVMRVFFSSHMFLFEHHLNFKALPNYSKLFSLNSFEKCNFPCLFRSHAPFEVI